MPDIYEVIHGICAAFPEVTEEAHGRHREYRVRGKSFANLTVNHHGDERLALLLSASQETQQMYVESAPKVFFVPPYVGHRGWYGVDLASDIRWQRVGELARDAYTRTAPVSLAKQAVVPADIPAPDSVDVRDIDPLFSPASQAALERLRQICLAFPEVSEGQSFGAPTFKAGKKTFVEFNTYSGGPAALFRVGAERQVALTADPRFDLPPYMGPKGWIRLSLDERFDDAEIRALADESYRHFALKRMLKALDGQ